ncbi:35512_t:CDS:1, partial [Racocetra persica]
ILKMSKLQASINYQYQLDNTSSNELHNSDDESVDTASSNNKVQMFRENLNKESGELDDEIDMSVL